MCDGGAGWYVEVPCMCNGGGEGIGDGGCEVCCRL